MEYDRTYRINGQLTNVLKLKAYIDIHFLEKISVFDLAIQLNYDWRYIGAAFVEMYGIKITDYINFLRVSYACKIIAKNPDVIIGELSTFCGYSSQSTFSRTFHSIVKISPLQYILKFKKGEITGYTFYNNYKNTVSL